MRLPGRAWLQFEVEPAGAGARIRQTAIFHPLGLAGLLYWYALYPIHRVIFAGMLRGIAAAALRSSVVAGAPPPGGPLQRRSRLRRPANASATRTTVATANPRHAPPATNSGVTPT